MRAFHPTFQSLLEPLKFSAVTMTTLKMLIQELICPKRDGYSLL